MAELAEIEAYRRIAESMALGRRIAAVEAPDAWYLKGGLTESMLPPLLVGRHFERADRLGKLLMLPTSEDGPVLGLRFGMSGHLIVDSTIGVPDMMYSPNRDNARWDRFTVRFDDGGRLMMRDARRLGGVTLDPGLAKMGPDALTATLGQLRRALASTRRTRGPAGPDGPGGSGPSGSEPPGALVASHTPLKVRLMDQSRLAGIGNLAADEMLWRAGLDPSRPAASLSEVELRRLQRHLRGTMRDLLERGGSHTGELMPARHPGGTCPKDGAPLRRARVGGRTTFWCPAHQH